MLLFPSLPNSFTLYSWEFLMLGEVSVQSLGGICKCLWEGMQWRPLSLWKPFLFKEIHFSVERIGESRVGFLERWGGASHIQGVLDWCICIYSTSYTISRIAALSFPRAMAGVGATIRDEGGNSKAVLIVICKRNSSKGFAGKGCAANTNKSSPKKSSVRFLDKVR